MASEKTEQLSYREQDVDATLSEHDKRISRLEQAGLIVLGYGVAEGANLVEAFTQLL